MIYGVDYLRAECNKYKAKLELLGIDASKIFGLKSGEIEISLLEFFRALRYPHTVKIPRFVKHIKYESLGRHGMDTLFDLLENIKEIIIPDTVEMTDNVYKMIKDLPELETISLNTRQWKLCAGLKARQNIRIPEESDMIITDKVKAIANIIAEQGQGKISGETLMVAFEAASRAADEETTLAILCSYALEVGVCSISELETYINKYTAQSMIDLYNKRTITNSQKATIIKANPLLINIFKIRKFIEEKYQIVKNEGLYTQIDTPGEGAFDIGQRFKPDIEIDEEVLAGFGGKGWLGYYEYTISGKVFPDLALDIIRLTSDNHHKTEVNGIELGRSYRHMDLNFFKQHWFVSNIAPVWCYPNGDIYDNGYNAGQTIQSIILEACCLAEEFKTLNMKVKIQSRNGAWVVDDNAIIIEIESGKVKAHLGGGFILSSSDYIARVNKLRQQGENVFSKEQLKAIQSSNTYESLLDTDIGKATIERQQYIHQFDCDLANRLNAYMIETRGLPLIVGNISNYNLLTYIFDYNKEKLQAYHEAYEKRREEWLDERERNKDQQL